MLFGRRRFFNAFYKAVFLSVLVRAGKKLKAKKSMIIEKMGKEKREIVVMMKDEGEKELPVTTITCPKCGNTKAYWWMQQTRSADEPPTLFYKCTKCGYTWREYG